MQAGVAVAVEQNDSMFGYFVALYVLNSLLGSHTVGIHHAHIQLIILVTIMQVHYVQQVFVPNNNIITP